jgi:NAD(P)-dependent dehydrogenase (short-subunit alcohol dehydrogenase family)
MKKPGWVSFSIVARHDAFQQKQPNRISAMASALITGTSTGIGLATSIHFAKNGYKVYAALRNLAKADPLKQAAAGGLDIEPIQLDVTSNESIDNAFNIMDAAGPIDVLVNNAGIGGASPLELTPEDEHRQMFDTNYFGAINCMQKVIPGMRERRKGAIVNITSLAGVFASPNQIAYSASKFALESAGEALAHELYRFNVRVVNVEPGVIMTNIFENSAESTRYDKSSPYQPIMRRNGKLFAAGFAAPAAPEIVAETIYEAVTSETYKLRWPVGNDAVSVIAGRATISDEEWISMGADLTDDEYNERFLRHFGVQL